MINSKDEEVIKTVVLKINKAVEFIKDNMPAANLEEYIATELTSFQETVTAALRTLEKTKSSETPLQVMKAEDVQQSVEEVLNSKINIPPKKDVNVTTLDSYSVQMLKGLKSSMSDLKLEIQNLKSLRPSKFLKFFSVLCFVAAIVSITWANRKVNTYQNQAMFWGNRAFNAAVLSDHDEPTRMYYIAAANYAEEPERVKQFVEMIEKDATEVQKIKKYLLSFMAEKHPWDISINRWECEGREYIIFYRLCDDVEAKLRAIHICPDGKVEETTDERVTDLKSARKYSKMKIWKTIHNPTEKK